MKINLLNTKCVGATGCYLICIFLIICNLNCSAQQNIQVDVTTKKIKPNDNKDDSYAIQQVINNAAPGSVLFFPAGVYTIDAPIKITAGNITIKGADSSSIFRFSNKADYYSQYGQKTGLLNIMANNVTIDHIVIDQNFRGSGRKPGEKPLIGGIFMGGSYTGKPVRTKNIIIQNCAVYDYYGDAISVFHSNIDNFKVVNNLLTSAFIVGNWDQCPKGGEQGINVASGTNLYIANNTIRGAIDDEIATHANCSNVTIIDNDITTIRGRLLLNGITNGVVKGNNIVYIRNGWAAFLVSYDKDARNLSMNNHLLIDNNKIYINKGVRVLTGIMLYGPGRNVTVSNNIIITEDKQPAGIQLAEQYSKTFKTFNFGDSIKIENNTIKNFRYGIKFNITNKVQQPSVEINQNNITGVEQNITRENTPFIIKLEPIE